MLFYRMVACDIILDNRIELIELDRDDSRY